jgi:hypothetical protein
MQQPASSPPDEHRLLICTQGDDVRTLRPWPSTPSPWEGSVETRDLVNGSPIVMIYGFLMMQFDNFKAIQVDAEIELQSKCVLVNDYIPGRFDFHNKLWLHTSQPSSCNVVISSKRTSWMHHLETTHKCYVLI